MKSSKEWIDLVGENYQVNHWLIRAIQSDALEEAAKIVKAPVAFPSGWNGSWVRVDHLHDIIRARAKELE